MKEIVEMIKGFFTKSDLKYTFHDEDSTFVTGIDMGNYLGKVKMIIFVEDSCYTVYTVLNSKADEEKISDVAEFLHRANYGLKNGNFEMDYNDGEIEYKVFTNCNEMELSESVVAESIILGPMMIKKYGKGLIKVMLGEGIPEECIKECERNEEE